MELGLENLLYKSKRTGRLRAVPDVYSLADVSEGQYYRNIFPYSEIPKVPFNERFVPMQTPKDVWITDTSFRDGQQARPPYEVEHIVQIFKYLRELGGENGMIRQTEFFVYSKRDRKRWKSAWPSIINIPR